MLAIAILAHAAEPANQDVAPIVVAFDGEVAKRLEKLAMGYWAPDADAMQNWLIDEKGIKKEEAKTLVGEPSTLTILAELGMVHLYTEQGFVSTPYEIIEADEAASMLTLRAKPPLGDGKPQLVKISIKKNQVTILGGEVSLILKKIDEAEFKKRKDALPADPVRL